MWGLNLCTGSLRPVQINGSHMIVTLVLLSTYCESKSNSKVNVRGGTLQGKAYNYRLANCGV